jgi:NAD(P)-dependent dehydrogenase (short-subunit alcohol dehydrogenase family)
MNTAVITGASRGLGRVLALELATRGTSLVVDARGSETLAQVRRELLDAGAPAVESLPGSVTDPAHRAALAGVVERTGRLDLLVNNASTLGPSPQPALVDYPLRDWAQVYDVNVTAPLALTQILVALLRRSGGTVVNITSDAAVEPYAGWGGYGSSKAALDHWTAILAVEEPALRVYSFDPGDMRTQMHQDAFPGEDISDRPLPETVVPAFARLIDERPPSGRYRAADLMTGRAPADAAVAS